MGCDLNSENRIIGCGDFNLDSHCVLRMCVHIYGSIPKRAFKIRLFMNWNKVS